MAKTMSSWIKPNRTDGFLYALLIVFTLGLFWPVIRLFVNPASQIPISLAFSPYFAAILATTLLVAMRPKASLQNCLPFLAVVLAGSLNLNSQDCPNLKQLILLSNPPISMIEEINKFPRLEQLTIVDSENTLATVEQRDIIRSALNSVIKLRIVDPRNEQIEPPKLFRDHLDKINSEIQKRRLSAPSK